MNKENLHLILEVADDSSRVSQIYNILNILFTVGSLIPLMFHQQTDLLIGIEMVCVIFFVIDYLFRWYTADKEYPEKSQTRAYLTYPFTIYAIFDLLAILPFLTVLNHSLRLFRIFRLVRSLRIFRAFRIFRHSIGLEILFRTVERQQKSLVIVGFLTVTYIFISALLVFNVEPNTFPTFVEALSWATSSLTTATYGEIFPKSLVGQLLAMIAKLIGVLIIAIPSSIMTAGYIEEMKKEQGIAPEEEKEKEN